VIGIKCATSKSKLLKECYSQLASPAGYEKQIGIFVPTGAVHLLGTKKYVNLLKDHNAFIDSIKSIPLGDFQHKMLDIPFSLVSTTDIEQVTLLDIIADQPWCLNTEKMKTLNKVMVTTTIQNLEAACKWLDTTLPDIYKMNIANKLNVTTLQQMIPCRLDKPILTAASTAYADKLKNHPTTTSNSSIKATQHTKPTCLHKKFMLVDMLFNKKEFPALPKANNLTQNKPSTSSIASTATTNSQTSTTTALPTFDYKAELSRLSTEIKMTLKKQFKDLFTQMDKKINNFMMTYNMQHQEQEKINETVTKQLSYLVDNMKRYLKLASPAVSTTHPLPRSQIGQWACIMSPHCHTPAPRQPNPSHNTNSHQLPQCQPTLPKQHTNPQYGILFIRN